MCENKGSRLTLYAILSMALFAVVTYLYVTEGTDCIKWRIIDKLNDRILALNLLSLFSIIFKDSLSRAFSYFNIIYLVLYASYEVLYIYSSATSSLITTFLFAVTTASYLTLETAVLTYIYYASRRNKA
jgi:hypothetical protein